MVWMARDFNFLEARLQLTDTMLKLHYLRDQRAEQPVSPLFRLLMGLLADQGRNELALRQYRHYSEALERCLQFLATLQYTDANTQHFADWYRPALLGAFHASHEDGNLRIDYTQHAVCALVQYLTHVVWTN